MDESSEMGAGCLTASGGEAGAGLVAACRRGEADALEHLVARYQAEIFGTVLRLVHDRDTALELTNAIFFKVSRNLDAYDTSRPLRPWLLRVATNESLNWLRARRRSRSYPGVQTPKRRHWQRNGVTPCALRSRGCQSITV